MGFTVPSKQVLGMAEMAQQFWAKSTYTQVTAVATYSERMWVWNHVLNIYGMKNWQLVLTVVMCLRQLLLLLAFP